MVLICGRGVKTNGKTPVKMLKLFALYENLCQFVTPWCTAMTDRPYPDTPITQGNNIIDISGTGLKQFWDLKAHLQDSSTLATANYPETLDRIFVSSRGPQTPPLAVLMGRLLGRLRSSRAYGAG